MKEINLNHICKVEGHADLSLKIEHNQVQICELKAAEGARFFEALVLGKKIEDIQEIVSRICGICSSSHSVACIQALEEALGLKHGEQQKILRELLMIGERIRSHATHLYFLALPDYLGFSSALSMSEKHQNKINDAIALISLGNKIVEFFGGREIHPFLTIKEKMPEKNQDYHEIIERLKQGKELTKKTIDLFLGLKYPHLERETSYLCLRNNDYAIISGKIVSDSGLIKDDDYKKHLKENIKEYATSKFVLQNDKPYMVGAMARLNNNHDKLDSETKKYLRKLKIPLNNPYYNNIAQAIELLYLINKTIRLIQRISPEKANQDMDFKIKQGHGISAVEAPRGTLFHEYKINKEGRIDYCNIITPTTQNLNMMESDIKQHVNSLLLKKPSKEKIVDEIEKLIRAYDPCFSCSTHFLKIKWL